MIRRVLLEEAIKKSWSLITTFPPDRAKWTSEVPSTGQCAITSSLVNKYLGGKIHLNENFHHYWNELESGELIDLTKDQFAKDAFIPSQGSRSRLSLLVGKGALKYKTLLRYLILRHKTKKTIKSFKPSLLLLSSNSSKEYIADIIEAIALPQGFVHHFRYQLRWLDKDMREELNYRDKKFSKYLKNLPVVIGYLRQKKNALNNYSWEKIVPVRRGKLKFAFKTSDDDGAFAHFYFELENHLVKSQNFRDSLMKKMGNGFNKNYVAYFHDGISNLEEKDSFNIICDELDENDFIPDNLDEVKKYNPPIYSLVNNLKYKRKISLGRIRKKVKEIKPKFDKFTLQSYYELRENTEYLLEFITYSKKAKVHFVARLSSDENYFITPKDYDLRLNSNYDQESWPIISKILERPIITTLKFSINNEPPNELDLDISVSLNLRIRKKYLFRIINLIGEVGFGIGTLYLALSQIPMNENWPDWIGFKWQGLVLCYATWIICKAISMFWRDTNV